MGNTNDIIVQAATASDVSSLTTILPRSFHPTNPYIEKCFPDTPLMRDYWTQIFNDEIQDESCHVFTALSSSNDTNRTESSTPATVIGVLCMRLMGANDTGCGFYTKFPLTKDHDQVLCEPMLGGMADNRERFMVGKAHFLIELFGVDHGLKGQGLGGRLLREACKVADQAGVETFVQANGSAKAVYERFGFEVKASFDMPKKDGIGEYVECMMVRKVLGR